MASSDMYESGHDTNPTIGEGATGMPVPTTPGRGFLILPPEIRVKIYKHLLTSAEKTTELMMVDSVGEDGETVWKFSPNRSGRSMHPAILSTCSRVYNEAVGLLYSENVFEVGLTEHIAEFVRLVGRLNASMIRHVRFTREFDLGYVDRWSVLKYETSSEVAGARDIPMYFPNVQTIEAVWKSLGGVLEMLPFTPVRGGSSDEQIREMIVHYDQDFQAAADACDSADTTPTAGVRLSVNMTYSKCAKVLERIIWHHDFPDYPCWDFRVLRPGLQIAFNERNLGPTKSYAEWRLWKKRREAAQKEGRKYESDGEEE